MRAVSSSERAERSTRGGRSFRRDPSKGDIREQAILDAASRLLAQRAFSDISVEEIAAAAGISRSSFYFYFSSKEAMLRALDERLGRAGLSRDEGHLPLPEAVRRGIEYAYRSWKEQGPVYRAIVSNMGFDRELAEQWNSQVEEMVARAAERIRRERKDGGAPAGPPSEHALASALTTLNEQCLLAMTAGRPFHIDETEIVNTLTTIWLRAIYGAEHPPTS